MVENSFIFKYGKHKGKSVAWVDDNDPSYLVWAQENAPNLLKDTPKKVEEKCDPKKVEFRKEPIKTVVPNMNFWNEGPDERSLAYLKKIAENLHDKELFPEKIKTANEFFDKLPKEESKQENKPDDEWGY